MWARRQKTLDFGPRVCFYCRPFVSVPSMGRWRRFIENIANLVHKHNDIDLLVIDTAASLLPAAENHAASQVKALSELHLLMEEGLAVLLLHHPKKGEVTIGQAPRGSGALPAFADILLELRVPRGSSETRRRRLHGPSPLSCRHRRPTRRCSTSPSAERPRGRSRPRQRRRRGYGR